MKRPAWATVVGILGIIFACLGILGAGYDIIMPKMMEFQGEMMSVMEKDIARQAVREKSESGVLEGDEPSPDEAETAPVPGPPPEMFRMMKRMWAVPEWFGMWSVLTGLLKALICGLILFASIGLLQTKPISIPLFYWGAGLAIVVGVVKGVVAVSWLGFMGMAMTFGGVFGAMIDLVLLVVVATGDKQAFRVKAAVAAAPPMQGPPPLPGL